MNYKYLILLNYFVSMGLLLTVSATSAKTPDAQHAWCNDVTLAIPQIKLKPCVDAQLQPAAVRTVQGRNIMLREFKPEHEPAARVLVIGGIHGDELTSSSIVFRWLELLIKPDNEALQHHWRVIPVLNPDGVLAKPPTRVNARGVDLNRNFPTYNWLREAPQYWQTQTGRDPRRFPGPSPLSEPESRWLHDEITRFKPDVIVSVHAPYGILDFDGPPRGIEAPARFGRLHLNRVGVYPGSLGNFGGLKEGIPVVTLELPHALKMPTEAELAHVWQDMQRWLKVNLVERRPAPNAPNAPATPNGEITEVNGIPTEALRKSANGIGARCCTCIFPLTPVAHTAACQTPGYFWPKGVF